MKLLSPALNPDTLTDAWLIEAVEIALVTGDDIADCRFSDDALENIEARRLEFHGCRFKNCQLL